MPALLALDLPKTGGSVLQSHQVERLREDWQRVHPTWLDRVFQPAANKSSDKASSL